MKVLIDTNVLVSAALSSAGTPFAAYIQATTYPNRGVICQQNINELKEVFERKLKSRLYSLDMFLAIALPTLELIPIPSFPHPLESMVRDQDDRTILRAALANNVDVILTGDKDLLEANIKEVKIMTPADFLILGLN